MVSGLVVTATYWSLSRWTYFDHVWCIICIYYKLLVRYNSIVTKLQEQDIISTQKFSHQQFFFDITIERRHTFPVANMEVFGFWWLIDGCYVLVCMLVSESDFKSLLENGTHLSPKRAHPYRWFSLMGSILE